MKIALIQFKSALAEPIKNAKRHLEFILKAKDQGADLIVFPEMSLFSYPLYDLPEDKNIITEQNLALDFILKNLPDSVSVLVGGLLQNTEKGKSFFNSAFLLSKSEKIKIFSKKLIPNYDIFDEHRFIQPSDKNFDNSVFSIKSKSFLLHICEDSWFGIDSLSNRHLHYVSEDFFKAKGNVDYVINMSASPFFQGKKNNRLNMAKNLTSNFDAHLLYVNLVGASDEVIFDGRSFVYSKNNKLLSEAKAFKEDILIVDTESKDLNSEVSGETNSKVILKDSHLNITRKALCFGLSEFIKQSGFKKIHIGLSGGVDSAVIACLATEALGSKNVQALSLPSQFSSQLSFDLASEQAKLLNISLKNISIQKMFQTCKQEIDLELNISSQSVIHENIQARLRSLVLMSYSQKEKSLLLNTSNKSEIAVGYSTLYGDLSGAICPIGDLLKTEVYALAEYYCKTGKISQSIIDRPPTAELKKDQLDKDSLPNYEILDFIIIKILNIKNSMILDEKFNPSFGDYIKNIYTKSELESVEKFCKTKILESEFKRFQAPPILKVSIKSFGQGRKMPVANYNLQIK
ncbi:MAG: NAD(+) synthase [Bdellovibrionales bacterium]|nr:NAD(+) synthase [Bdellovibrionales bacterium]